MQVSLNVGHTEGVCMCACHSYKVKQCLLYRLLLELNNKEDSQVPDSQGQRWSEFVDDLWTEYLPHIKEEQIRDDAFVYDTEKGCFGFQEGSDEEDIYMSTKGGEL